MNPLDRIAAVVAERAGLRVPRWVLAARVQARIREGISADAGREGEATHAQIGAPDADFGDPASRAYAALITGSSVAAETERAALFEALRVGETRFFRHQQHLQTLIEFVVPALAGKHRDTNLRPTVRAWSAGCASGEEAYTLAMVLGALLPRCDVRVLGTDLSSTALDHARAGRYSADALTHVPARWRDLGFESEIPANASDAPNASDALNTSAVVRRNTYRISPAVRACVTFARHNLLDSRMPAGWEQEQFDIIWCRNVFIYFAPEARRRCAAWLADRLTADGVLFPGYSESLHDVTELAAVRTPASVIYRRCPAPAADERASADAPTTIAPSPSRPQRRKRVTNAPATVAPSPSRPQRRKRITDAPAPVAPSPSRPQRRPRATDTPAPSASSSPQPEIVRLSGGYEDPQRLADELRTSMADARQQVIIDLDGATYLDDQAASILRRAARAARAAGTQMVLRARRAGTRRWLRRHGLRDADDSMRDLPAMWSQSGSEPR